MLLWGNVAVSYGIWDVVVRECGCLPRNMVCCCEGMCLFPKEYGVLLWGYVAVSQGIWCVVVKSCGCFLRYMECSCEVMWLFPSQRLCGVVLRECGCVPRNMEWCCEWMWLFPKEYEVLECVKKRYVSPLVYWGCTIATLIQSISIFNCFSQWCFFCVFLYCVCILIVLLYINNRLPPPPVPTICPDICILYDEKIHIWIYKYMIGVLSCLSGAGGIMWLFLKENGLLIECKWNEIKTM